MASGEAKKKMDLTGAAVDVLCGVSELGRNGEVMGEKIELGEAGETGDMVQTIELSGVSQVIGELGVPGIAAGELGEGGVNTDERGEGGVSTGE